MKKKTHETLQNIAALVFLLVGIDFLATGMAATIDFAPTIPTWIWGAVGATFVVIWNALRTR